MNRLTLIASATSRLHADIMLVRLRRAEFECSQVSALFPSGCMPNAVSCWLPMANDSSFQLSGESVTCAGWLRKSAGPGTRFRNALKKAGRGILGLLSRENIDESGAHILAEQLEQGHILLAVHARNEFQASVAWDVFRQAHGETIVIGSNLTRNPTRQSREGRPVLAWTTAVA